VQTKIFEGKQETKMSNLPTIDFEKMDGLVPGIVQDARTGEMLMLGFLNAVSYAKTLETGICDLLEPHAPEAVDEGRDQRQPAARDFGRDRLRQRRAAFAWRWKATAWCATRAR
jgi:hypothetical protein